MDSRGGKSEAGKAIDRSVYCNQGPPVVRRAADNGEKRKEFIS